MSVPADGQLSALWRLPSHQEAVTSAALVQPSLGGDKTQQSLNALIARSEEEEKEEAEKDGGRKERD